MGASGLPDLRIHLRATGLTVEGMYKQCTQGPGDRESLHEETEEQGLNSFFKFVGSP